MGMKVNNSLCLSSLNKRWEGSTLIYSVSPLGITHQAIALFTSTFSFHLCNALFLAAFFPHLGVAVLFCLITPRVNFLFASVCVLFMAETARGEQL